MRVHNNLLLRDEDSLNKGIDRERQLLSRVKHHYIVVREQFDVDCQGLDEPMKTMPICTIATVLIAIVFARVV